MCGQVHVRSVTVPDGAGDVLSAAVVVVVVVFVGVVTAGWVTRVYRNTYGLWLCLMVPGLFSLLLLLLVLVLLLL